MLFGKRNLNLIKEKPIIGTFYRAWLLLSKVLGVINSSLLLFAFYYAILLPLGLVLKVMGHKPMGQIKQASLESYRVSSPKRDINHFERPY